MYFWARKSTDHFSYMADFLHILVLYLRHFERSNHLQLECIFGTHLCTCSVGSIISFVVCFHRFWTLCYSSITMFILENILKLLYRSYDQACHPTDRTNKCPNFSYLKTVGVLAQCFLALSDRNFYSVVSLVLSILRAQKSGSFCNQRLGKGHFRP